MPFSKRSSVVPAAATLALLGASFAAHAVVVFTVAQIGADVLLTGADGLTTTGLPFTTAGTHLVTVVPRNGAIAVRSGSSEADTSVTFSGDKVFGVPTFNSGTAGTGNAFGLTAGTGFLYVPVGHVSGSALAGTATFANKTMAGLAHTTGAYTTHYSYVARGTTYLDSFLSYVLLLLRSPNPRPAP